MTLRIILLLIFSVETISEYQTSNCSEDIMVRVVDHSDGTTIESLINTNTNVKIDQSFPVYKSSLFFAWKWPYLSPLGPSGNYICLCPPQSGSSQQILPTGLTTPSTTASTLQPNTVTTSTTLAPAIQLYNSDDSLKQKPKITAKKLIKKNNNQSNSKSNGSAKNEAVKQEKRVINNNMSGIKKIHQTLKNKKQNDKKAMKVTQTPKKMSQPIHTANDRIDNKMQSSIEERRRRIEIINSKYTKHMQKQSEKRKNSRNKRINNKS